MNNKTQKYLCSRHRCQVSHYGEILERTPYDKNAIVINDEYAEILIQNKKSKTELKCLISLDKVDKVKNHNWRLHTHGYICGKVNNKEVLIHRFILDIHEKDVQIDHINRNKLDNRTENLRMVNASENQVNKKMLKSNSSGVTGVTWDKSRDKWKVSLNIYEKCYNLGRYDNFDKAVEVRRSAEKKYHKEFTPIERR